MPLTLVTGPANAGKAGRVLGAHRAALGRDPVLVVPTAADVAHYVRELAGRGAVFGGSVVTFRGLIAEIAGSVGYQGRRLSFVQRDRVIATALARCSFSALERSAASAGFAAAAGELIAELQRALIDPPRFTGALRDWAAADPEREAYGREVAAIYAAYRRELDRVGRVDDDLYARRTLDALRATPAAWRARTVSFYGFDDLTGLQRDAVDALARVAAVDVVVALPFEAGREAFAARAGTVAELTPLADRVEALGARDEHYAPGSRIALHHLERTLFESGAHEVAAGDAVRVLEAGGGRAEIELVAAEILDLLRSGIEAHDIAVVHRSPRTAAALVAQVFDAYGVPHAVTRSVRLRHTTLGRGLCALLRCGLPDTGAGAEAVLAYLRTPGRLDVLALADRLEEDLRVAGEGTVVAALARWERIAGWPLSDVVRVRDAAIGDPAALLDEVRSAATFLFTHPRERRAPVLEAGEREDARVLGAVTGAVAQLHDLGAADPATLPTPRELLEALGDLEVRLGEADAAGVRVAGPLDVRARRFAAIFVCGLQEGVFPERGRPEPFLPDEMRREVNAASGLRLEPKEDTLGAERYLFYACVSRAQDRVALSWRSSDEEGNPALPSFFLSDVAAVFAGDLVDDPARDRPLAQVTWPLRQAPTPAERLRSLAAGGPRVAPEPIASLSSSAVLDRLAGAVFSPSALEAYVACPVRWLVDRRLRPRQLAPDAEPLVRGRFFHQVLDGVLATLRDQTGSARVTPASLPIARRIAGEVIAAGRAELPLSPHEPTARAEVRRLERDLLRYLDREAEIVGGWEPTHLEWRFGFDDSGAGVLRLGDDELHIRGTIDRVEIHGDEAIVRDYKASTAHAIARWEPEGLLQVGIYMLAVRELLGKEVVAGLYQPLGRDLRPRGLVSKEHAAGLPLEGFFANDLLADEAFAERLADVEQRAMEAVRTLRSGGLAPAPDTCSSRVGCRYPGICRWGAAA